MKMTWWTATSFAIVVSGLTETGESLLLRVIDGIEQRESRLLVWGYVDGYFSAEELDSLIEPVFESAVLDGLDDFYDTQEVLDLLLERALIFSIELPNGESGFRSRMAETIRLLLRLRQLFPKHTRSDSGWQDAAPLVADFRFKWRQREYPKRDLSSKTALARIRKVSRHPSMVTGAEAVLRPPSAPPMRLAGFQLRATERILRGLDQRRTDKHKDALGTIVCAGTGSGKTLAFYLPALSTILRARSDAGTQEPWVKVVAIYPRIELLKDQLREVLERTSLLDAALKEIGESPIRIGALFGETPTNGKHCYGWRQRENGNVICPTIRCLECGGELDWEYEDRIAGRERLVCGNCGIARHEDRLVLTRESMAKAPPDILFTTTEMLNQRLADTKINHLFGVGPRAACGPELVLLDEVHTYEERYGAQVAFLIRRWRHLLREPICCVGLSATLRDAPNFFAELTGIRQTNVVEVSPLTDEMEAEGAEYLIALRGDPVSRTALLSTTIQTSMLLQRSLDPPRDLKSKGAFGQRSFVFSDNLDATNRLYFDLLSAEGRNSWKNPDMNRSPNGGLAVLRGSKLSYARYQHGQDWRMCETIGHDLSNRLNIERVSSQDRGIASDADVVIATAALEVGFDDPSVGAVIQHKAPRSMASFMQRKGRAGRMRGMRPWMAIVLSDYGRDRASYQSYDQLFDPELPVRTLPLNNRYVKRMQAVFAIIDMLGTRLQDFQPRGGTWKALTKPSKWIHEKKRQARLAKLISILLNSPSGTAELKRYLVSALMLPPDEVDALLWEYPRPLLTSALPTVLRRLESGWSARGVPAQDTVVDNNPLPDFIPASLFADLNLAEVRLDLQGPHWEKEHPALPVLSAIREFAPGRISRRYGVQRAAERYWIGPDISYLVQVADSSGPFRLELAEFGTYAPVGQFLYEDNSGRVIDTPVVRPITLKPTSPSRKVQDSSNARPIWNSQLVPIGQPIELEPPDGDGWRRLFPKLKFFTHAQHAPIEVRRFATGAIADINLEGGEGVRLCSHFVLGDEPTALGLTFATDGLMFQLEIPERLHLSGAPDSSLWRALRSGRYFFRSWSGEVLAQITNPFLREWLAQVYLAAIVFEASTAQIDLKMAADAVARGTSQIKLEEVPERLFQSVIIDDDAETKTGTSHDRLRQELSAQLREPTVLAELRDMARNLWEPISDEWEAWLRTTFHTTVAAAILKAIVDLCPSIDPDTLIVDLSRGPNQLIETPEISEIWITESSPGGSGLIEEFLRRYSEDPRRFFSLVRAALEMGEFEMTDHQLTELLDHLTDHNCQSPVKDAVNALRKSNKHADLVDAHMELRHSLTAQGVAPYHGFLVALGNRVIRPGAGPKTDEYLAAAIRNWEEEEKRLGLEIDLRLAAFWLSQSSDIDEVVRAAGVPSHTDDIATLRMSAIYGLLWPRGRTIRHATLPLSNPFSETYPTERLLASVALADDRLRISVTIPDWMESAFLSLAEGQLVTLTCDSSERGLLTKALNELITNPISTDYIRAYARLQGIRQNGRVIEADIELPEAAQ